MEDESRYYPCQERGVAGGKACPFPTARFALDGGYRGDAREVEQYEEEEAIGGERCLGCCLGIAVTVGLL